MGVFGGRATFLRLSELSGDVDTLDSLRRVFLPQICELDLHRVSHHTDVCDLVAGSTRLEGLAVDV